jgi:alpha-mannosidase
VLVPERPRALAASAAPAGSAAPVASAETASPAEAAAPAAELSLEPAQPVFTRYWLHGKGPAPAGNLPVAVHLSPGRVALLPDTAEDPAGSAEHAGSVEDPAGSVEDPAGSVEDPAGSVEDPAGSVEDPAGSVEDPAGSAAGLRLTVACGTAPASGTVQLDTGGQLSLEPAGPLSYDLGARGHACWDLTVRARPGTRPGRHFVTARIADRGQFFEDAVLVSVGEPAAPALDLPLDELFPLYLADQQRAAEELDLALLTPELRLRPGGRGEIVVRLVNATASQIRGEAQLVSPFGSWAQARPWTQGFTVEPGRDATLTTAVTAAGTARPGEHWWALVKVMYFGRLRYTEPASVTITA